MKSMRTSINRFLAKATGPVRLRSGLGRKTRPVSALLDKIDLASAVRAEVPKNVLGGDILALMSEQLRQAIQYPEQDEGAANDAPQSQFSLEPQPGSIAGRAEAQTSPLPTDVKTARPTLEPEKAADSDRRPPTLKNRESAEKHVTGEQADATTFIKKLQEYRQLTQQERPAEPVPRQQDRRAAAPFPESTPRVVPETSWPGLESDAASGREAFLSSTGKTDSVERREPQNVTPVLVEKLREYWQLSRPESSSEKISAYPGSPITDRSKTPSFPEITRHAPIQMSWPEMTGRQVAEKIDSFISGRGAPGFPAKSVRQVIQSDLPEKIEIQNVFNIQVKSEEGREKSRDLSEKIADILHEQALQHGIDVT